MLISLFTASLFSAFIYLEHFHISNHFVESIFGLGAIYLILTQRKLFWTGFFIGMFWFFWVGFSMQYYDFIYLIPFVIFLFSFAYGSIFYLIGYYENIWIRSTLLVLVSLFEPFGFNWFKPQIIFVNTNFGTELWQFSIIVFTIALMIFAKGRRIFLIPTIILLISAQNFKPKNLNKSLPFEIAVTETKVKQNEKWVLANQDEIIDMNLRKIELAIQNHQKLIILPESTFPLFINTRLDIVETLENLSLEIAILTGGLYLEDGNNYNASYLFQNGNYQVAKKVVLVPFGEYIPLPKFLSDWINSIFFQGMKDFTPATSPTDFKIGDEVFRNAICYEATSKEMYKNPPKFMIAISNNGWFLPSIEPTLQKLLIQHFANINNITVIHSSNMAGTDIIYPKYKGQK